MSDLESLFPLLICSGWLILVGIFVWSIFDTAAFLEYAGEIRRGFTVWSEPLSPARYAFLKSLKRNIVEEAYLRGSKAVSFIRVQERQVLIQRQRPNWRTSWPYVGYVDLREEIPVIEYRFSLSSHLLLLPFILTIVAIPFVGLIMVINYLMEQGSILGFIDEQMALAVSEGDVP